MNWREIVIGGLLLPFELYFQPTRFRKRVHALAPELDEDYNLWQARKYWKKRTFRQGLIHLSLQALVALIWSPVLVLGFMQLGVEGNVSSLAFGIVFGVIFGVVFAMVLSIAIKVIGGITIGVVAGVSVGVGLSVTFGIVLGVAIGIALGVAFGVVGGMLKGIAASLSFGVVFGISFGVVFGVSFDMTSDIVGGVAFGIASIITVTHIWLYPFWLMINSLQTIWTRSNPLAVQSLWRWNPVRWDETIILPLFGLDDLLSTYFLYNLEGGARALNEIVIHPFQSEILWRVLAKIAKFNAQEVSNIQQISAFKRGLDWLTTETEILEQDKNILLRLHDISQEVDAALQSNSALNRVTRLTQALNTLELARPQAGSFNLAVSQWHKIIIQALDEAQYEQQQLEPIPNPYISDGKPLRPDQRVNEEQVFKGRESLFQQIESVTDGQGKTFLLIGQRRSGKTSALLHLPRRLGAGVVAGFIDMQNIALGEDTRTILQK